MLREQIHFLESIYHSSNNRTRRHYEGNSMKKSDGEQIKRFKEAARELECDEDEAKFNTQLKKITQAKPETDKKKD